MWAEYHIKIDEALIDFLQGDNTLNEALSKINNALDIVINIEIEQYERSKNV